MSVYYLENGIILFFSVNDTSQLGDIVKGSIELERKGVAIQNRKGQFLEYSTMMIVEMLYEDYKHVITYPKT